MLAGLLVVTGLGGCRSVPEGSARMVLEKEPVGGGRTGLRVSPSRPEPLRDWPNRYREVLVDGPYIAMTFDDGPHARQTPALLDILKKRGIRATFFVVGRNAAAHPGILRRMVAEGHEIGNHSWDHARLDLLSVEEASRQIQHTNVAIETAIGDLPALVRPPYGATDPGLNRWLAEAFGLKVILWSVDSRDWKHRNGSSIQHSIMSATKPGAIILAHDVHATTVAAMPRVLDELRAAGYQFVTVSELIALEKPVQRRAFWENK